MSKDIKYFLILVTLTFVISPIVFGQTNDKNSARKSKVVEEIKRMDRQWIIEAYGSRDLKDFDRIVAADFLITGSDGKILNKEQKRANVVADSAEPPSSDAVFKIEDSSTNVRVFNKAAVSTGYIIEKYVFRGVKNDSRVYFTNTYLKRNGQWQVIASQFMRIKQSQ